MHRNILILIAILVTSQTTFASEPGSWNYAGNVNGVNKSVESERSYGVLSYYEFEKFQQSMSYVVGSKCKHDLNELLHAIVKGLPWAVASEFMILFGDSLDGSVTRALIDFLNK